MNHTILWFQLMNTLGYINDYSSPIWLFFSYLFNHSSGYGVFWFDIISCTEQGTSERVKEIRSGFRSSVDPDSFHPFLHHHYQEKFSTVVNSALLNLLHQICGFETSLHQLTREIVRDFRRHLDLISFWFLLIEQLWLWSWKEKPFSSFEAYNYQRCG